jgi:cell division protease FtsH
LTERRADLETLAKGLLEYETLSGDEIIGLLEGRQPIREVPEETPPVRTPASPVPATGTSRPPRPEHGLEPQPQV